MAGRFQIWCSAKGGGEGKQTSSSSFSWFLLQGGQERGQERWKAWPRPSHHFWIFPGAPAFGFRPATAHNLLGVNNLHSLLRVQLNGALSQSVRLIVYTSVLTFHSSLIPRDALGQNQSRYRAVEEVWEFCILHLPLRAGRRSDPACQLQRSHLSPPSQAFLSWFS